DGALLADSGDALASRRALPAADGLARHPRCAPSAACGGWPGERARRLRHGRRLWPGESSGAGVLVGVGRRRGGEWRDRPGDRDLPDGILPRRPALERRLWLAGWLGATLGASTGLPTARRRLR